MKKIILAFFCTFTFAAQVSSESLNNYRFITENYPPYNFEKDNQLQGISIDLIELLIKATGSQKTRQDFLLEPWARGYAETLKNKNTLLFATTRTKKRENMFKWVGPIAKTKIVLIAQKKDNIKISSLNDLSNYRIGVVLKDIGQQLLNETGLNLKIDPVAGTGAIKKSIKKLNIGRINLWAYEENVAMWSIKNLGFNPSDYEPVYVLKEAKLYYAFNKNTPDSFINDLNQELDKIRNSPEYKKLIHTYLK